MISLQAGWDGAEYGMGLDGMAWHGIGSAPPSPCGCT